MLPITHSLHNLYSQRRRLHGVKSHLEMLTALEATPVIHIASASAISVTARKLDAIRAGLERKSATKPSPNARTVIAAGLHALAMGQSPSRLKKEPVPTVARRFHCNRKFKMHPSSHRRHCHQMVLGMTIGVGYRQHQQPKNHTTASLLQHKAHTMRDILKAAMSGAAPHGNTGIRKVHSLSTIPSHRLSTTINRCHPPHTLNLDHQVIHGDTTRTPHISPALLRP